MSYLLLFISPVVTLYLISFIITMLSASLVHYSMVHVLWVVEGGIDLTIWKVAASILNKQLQTADKELYSILRVGWG
jgi:hypothetical protein